MADTALMVTAPVYIALYIGDMSHKAAQSVYPYDVI
jgi:hypothetical protein